MRRLANAFGQFARRAASARARLVAMSVAGLGAYFVAPQAWPAALRVLTAWDVAALVFLVPTLWMVLGADADETRHLSTRADPARVSARLLLLAASGVSLAAVSRGLAEASRRGGTLEIALTAVSLLAVALSWGTLHVVYTLHYANLYYAGERGVDFNQDGAPNYRDFLYLAFTVGMTYQVSDTQITSPALRFEVIKHALLSFVFGTAIVALSINVTAGLLK